MKLLLFLAYVAIVAGCATVAENIQPGNYPKRDIKFTINGVKSGGAIVVPSAPSYEIKGESRGGDFDYLVIRSCHREVTAEKEGSDFKYTYTPKPGIEDNRACPLEITGIEKVKARNSYGFIDFEDSRDTLPATLECNGSTKNMNGTSVCQAASGLIQRIRFTVPVFSATGSNPACIMPEPKDAMTFEFKMPAKQCLFKFMEKAEPHRTHRMTSLGFDLTVVRNI